MEVVMEAVVVKQSELEKRGPTDIEQAELDRRAVKIGKGEMKDDELFDKEEAAPKKKEPEKKAGDQELSDAELLEVEDKGLNEKQKTRKSELVKAKEVLEKEEADEKLLNSKDEDLDDKQKEEKNELIKAKKGTKSEEEKQKELEAEVKSYASEHQVSEEDARKDLESIGKIAENSKHDTKTMAKNYLHLQRAKARTDEELKALKDTPVKTQPPTIKAVREAIEAGELADSKGAKLTKDKVVEAYKEKYPEVTETADEDTIFRMACKDIQTYLEEREKGDLAEIKGKAQGKKAKLISSMSDADKKFLPEIQPLLDNYSDSHIMNEKFNLDDMVLWAKGKTYDTAVKDADGRGFKRGTEARNIVGEIKKPGEGKAKTKDLGKKGTTALTDAQKKTAEEYFENDDIPLETKYKHYEEILEHEKQLKEKNKKKGE